MNKFIALILFLIATTAGAASIPFSPELDSRLATIEAGTSMGTAVITAAHLAPDSCAASEIASGAVGTDELASGAVANVDVSASAGIAFSKLEALNSATMLVGNGSNVAAAVTITGDVTVSNAGVTAVGSGKITEAMVQVPTPTSAGGLFVKRVAAVTFDPSANADQRTADTAFPIGVVLPDNAVITSAYYDVITTFQSAGADAATIAISVEGANDIVTATAISAGGDIWDAGLHVGVPVPQTAATWVKTSTAAKKITVTTAAANALTAGKMVIYVEYMVSL